MAYGLKYTAEFQNSRRWFYRLQVYQRDYSGTSKTMGDLCGCVLEVQGNMDSIIAPIVKTQLRFSLVDTSDKTDTQATKYGDWQEFYTPDSTLYKVVLSEAETGTSYTEIWAGYITPDSWREDLDYRGTVTITARDNIGHLKDFQFKAEGRVTPDENGLVRVNDILQGAMDIIEFPMSYSLQQGGTHEGSTYAPYEIVSQDGVKLWNAMVNAALFEGMNWYDVFEQTLEAMGYAFRYVGKKICAIGYLRMMPRMNNSFDQTGTQELEFYGGTLELDPAVKSIEENQDYKQESEAQLEHLDGLTFGTAGTYRCQVNGNPWPSNPSGHTTVVEHDAPVQLVTSGGRSGWDVGSGMLDPSGYLPDNFLKRAEGEDGWRNYAFVASNQVLNGSSPTATFTFPTRTAAVKVTIKFTPSPLCIRDEGGFAGLIGDYNYSLYRISYYVMFTDGTTTKYWNGGRWDDNPYLLEQTFDTEHQHETDLVIDMGECDAITVGSMSIRLGQVEYKCFYDGGDGCYARVASIKAEINGTTALKSNKVTTINSDAYNVLLNRKPIFGALSREMSFVKPENYLAGIFFKTYGSYPQPLPYMMKFDDQSDDYLVPLPVLIHQQILCYYYGAARVLTGSCTAEKDVTGRGHYDFSKLATYKGRKYLFQGGTFDMFSGIINSAYFREFIDYDDLWDGAPPSYSEDVKYND